jgi:hypothetical protein
MFKAVRTELGELAPLNKKNFLILQEMTDRFFYRVIAYPESDLWNHIRLHFFDELPT